MARTPVSFRNTEVEQALEARARGRSLGLTAQDQLERYFHVLAAELSSLEFSQAELWMMADVSNGTFWQPFSMALIALEVEDSLEDGTAKKHGVDGSAFVSRLKSLTVTQSFAVVDALERWWNLPGEQRNANGFVRVGFRGMGKI